jgi:RNA recognition motif-containing protein
MHQTPFKFDLRTPRLVSLLDNVEALVPPLTLVLTHHAPCRSRSLGSLVNTENKLFVGMLPALADEAMLMDLLEPYGALSEVYIMRTPEGTPRGCAFVRFEERSSANAAIQSLNDTLVSQG